MENISISMVRHKDERPTGETAGIDRQSTRSNEVKQIGVNMVRSEYI